ncbi:hypothetical protein CY34DRAFT_798752 [Suillus luteus UH-Slu-Lm8-n1]|uniref:Uncharacterized protein n=1 Tax=Suillus luteus UH-Slu-Lm8-n1 TaxID=930992 RepID=A0A0D0BDJ1_9AGAM|nr:hypothetical protein CY34DRAFT_798752 [Suillus luteus UH-Slu-Lm8-n1]
MQEFPGIASWRDFIPAARRFSLTQCDSEANLQGSPKSTIDYILSHLHIVIALAPLHIDYHYVHIPIEQVVILTRDTSLQGNT